MTIEELKKREEEYQELGTYYLQVQFPILSEKFFTMSRLCRDMIEILENK